MKVLLIGSLTFFLLLCLWFLGTVTSILQFYRTTSSANEPTIKYGQFLFISRLRKPRLLRFIAYRTTTPETGLTTFIHRICGMPGDLIEIKGGVLHINGKNMDDTLDLKHVYKLHSKDATAITFNPADSYTIDPYPDTLYVTLNDATVRANSWPCTRHVLPPGLRDNAIYATFKKNWNPDNFGPLRIPSGKYFVLGDNREQSSDSRYHGLIDATKFLGTVLWK